MLKYLLLIALAAVVWWLWQKGTRSRAEGPRQEAPPERMIACAHCGLHLPQGESFAEGRLYYCCEAHRRAGPR